MDESTKGILLLILFLIIAAGLITLAVYRVRSASGDPKVFDAAQEQKNANNLALYV